jgi:predicted HTH domain antitoxin
MTVTICDEVVQSAHLSESELKVELAVALFRPDRLTLVHAPDQLMTTALQLILMSRHL